MPTKLIKLSDGLLVEVEVTGNEAQQISGGAAEKVKASMEKIQPILTAICRPLTAAWHEISQETAIEKATIELGLSFEGEGNLFVTKSKAGANLTITLELKPKPAAATILTAQE